MDAITAKCTGETIQEIFDKFELSGEDHELSWSKLYDLYTPQAIRGLYEHFSHFRSVNINSNDNNESENVVNDLIDIDQSPPHTSHLIESKRNYMSIRRPTRKVSQITTSVNPFAITSDQSSVSTSVINTETSNTTTRLNSLYNKVNSIPIRTTCVTVSHTITTTANMTANTTTVFSTIRNPIPAQIPTINLNQRQFKRHSVRVPNILSSFNYTPITITHLRTNTFNAIPIVTQYSISNPPIQANIPRSQSNQNSGDQCIGEPHN